MTTSLNVLTLLFEGLKLPKLSFRQHGISGNKVTKLGTEQGKLQGTVACIHRVLSRHTSHRLCAQFARSKA